MKTFKENFPNIYIKEQVPFELKDLRYTRWTMEELLKTIQETCLDKQKVREAKNKVEKIIYNVRSLLKDTNLKYAQDIDGKVWEAHEMLWDAVEKLEELELDK